MKTWDRVAIVGVGLIGGSIGLDLRKRGLAREVVGVGRRAESLRAAKKVGAVTSTSTDLARGVAEAQLVVVCTPVGRIAADVLAAAAACEPGTIITDAGSTKAAIVEAVADRLPAKIHFVGSHPLAGGEKSGPTAAVRDLFVDRTVVITPTKATAATAQRTVKQFWKSLGANVVEMSPEAHDRALAMTSHLPHLAASALAGTLAADERDLVARGFLDTTRVASGDPEMWQQIFAANRAHVLTALARYEKLLASFRRAIENEDAAAVKRLLTVAKRTRDALGS